MQQGVRTTAGTHAADAFAFEISYHRYGGMRHQTIARQTVSTDDNDGGAPRGGDGRRGSRIRTHMNISGNQSADRWAAGADVNKPASSPCFSNRPVSFAIHSGAR